MKQDWHSADIIAAIKKKGSSLSQISRSAGLNSSTLNNALSRRWPKEAHYCQFWVLHHLKFGHRVITKIT